MHLDDNGCCFPRFDMQDSGFQLFESNKVDTNLSEDLDEHMEDELTGSIGDMYV
ncbi:hypothetical protein RchiOBHm_Chr4g0396221 [Rosa chinensis]|uniref:Uncharacterized protein n=1 Tax=Rosa chinensis TaxID=74649 RepID=A0A2P6QRP8_ROSCH|nr:hypothetical protein RchiOBHm_Chr4g0396221 [Rosa chinensis]